MNEPKKTYEAIVSSLEEAAFKPRLEALKEGLTGDALAAAESNIKIIEDFRAQVQRMFVGLKPLEESINAQPDEFLKTLEELFHHNGERRTAEEVINYLKNNGILNEITQGGSDKKILKVSQEWIKSKYNMMEQSTQDEGIQKQIKEAAEKHIGELESAATAGTQQAAGWMARVKEDLRHPIENTKASFGGSSLVGKTVKGAGAVVSVGAIIDGTRRAISKDDEGNRHVAVGGLEVAAGAGGLYASLFRKLGEQAAKTAAHAV
jgi:uncharacterized protein (UPF0147 family)